MNGGEKKPNSRNLDTEDDIYIFKKTYYVWLSWEYQGNLNAEGSLLK